MFELFAVFVILGLAVSVCVAAAAFVKFTVSLVLLPFKLLMFPIMAIFAVVAGAVALAVGVAVVGALVAVIIPVVIVGAVVAVPIVFVAAVT